MKYVLFLMATATAFCISSAQGKAKVLLDRPTAFQSYGVGATGVARISECLKNPSASRQQKRDALEALTFYGKGAVEPLLDFAERSNGDASWNMEVARAMCRIIDRRLIPGLIRLTKEKANPVAQENALIALASLVEWTPLIVEVPAPPGSRRAISYIGGSTLGSAHSVGLLLESSDFDVIRRAAHQVLSASGSDRSVQHAAHYLSSLLEKRQTRKSETEFQSPH